MSSSGNSADVVLVHGLWMHGAVMSLLARRLARHGLVAQRFSYPSVARGLDDNAAALADFVARLTAPRIHLLGHSLGGLVALRMLALHGDARVRRLVLLACPVAGSASARWLLAWRQGPAMVGRSMRDWLAAPAPTAPAGIECGVIAGDRSFGIARLLPGVPRPNDGVVAVAETHLAGAADRLLLHASHSELLISRPCADAVARFLANGRFGG